MKTAAALLLAVGTFGVGLLAGRLLSHGDEVCKVEAAPAAAVRAQPTGVASPGPRPDLEQPDSRVVITPPSPPQPGIAPQAPEQAVQEQSPKPDTSDPRGLPESTLEEMRSKCWAIGQYLGVRAQPIIKQRFADNLCERVSDDRDDSEWERSMICGFQRRYEAHARYRTVLPRDQYPELYVYKDELIRLGKLERAAEEELARQLAAPR